MSYRITAKFLLKHGLAIQAQHCKGAAMVEFAMLLGVMLPIGLGMSMLSKLSDVQLSAQQASRYSAWEATVYSRQALLEHQSATVDSRFFQRPDASIQTLTGQEPEDQSEHPRWGKTVTRAGMLDLTTVALHDAEPTSIGYDFDTGKAEAGALTGETVSAAGSFLSRVSGNSWGLLEDGLLHSDVSVPLQQRGLLQPGKGVCSAASENGVGNGNSNGHSHGNGNSNAESTDDQPLLCLSSAGVILADGWGASGDQQSKERIRSLVPSSALQSVGSGVSFLLGSLLFPELDPLNDAFGHVSMQALPRYAQPEP